MMALESFEALQAFRAFSALHAVTLVAIATLTGLAILVARIRGPSQRASPAERLVGWAYLAAWVTTYSYFLFSPLHEPAKTLPLQLCHITAALAALLLITRWQWLRPLVYFWGLALCTQALVTPSLTEGPALYPYWFFWSTHGMIVGVALYEVFARRYRPALRDYGVACAAAAAYFALVLPLDIAFGWNYGFVGPDKPEVRTIVDALGPWPLRLAPMVALVAAAMGLLLLPWQYKNRR